MITRLILASMFWPPITNYQERSHGWYKLILCLFLTNMIELLMLEHVFDHTCLLPQSLSPLTLLTLFTYSPPSLFSNFFIQVDATFWGEAGPFWMQGGGSHQDSSLPCSANEPAVYWQEDVGGGARATTNKNPTHWTTETSGTAILASCRSALHFSTRPNSCWKLVSLKARRSIKYDV